MNMLGALRQDNSRSISVRLANSATIDVSDGLESDTDYDVGTMRHVSS